MSTYEVLWSGVSLSVVWRGAALLNERQVTIKAFFFPWVLKSQSVSHILLLFNCIGFFGFSSTLIYKNCRQLPSQDRWQNIYRRHISAVLLRTSSAFTEQVFFLKVERPACEKFLKDPWVLPYVSSWNVLLMPAGYWQNLQTPRELPPVRVIANRVCQSFTVIQLHRIFWI